MQGMQDCIHGMPGSEYIFDCGRIFRPANWSDRWFRAYGGWRAAVVPSNWLRIPRDRTGLRHEDKSWRHYNRGEQ